MENKSGRKPLGVAVLLKPYTPERVGGKIELPPDVARQLAMVDNRATVIEVGSSAWLDEKEPRAKPGDNVIITKFAGYMLLGDDGEQYRMVNDRDIFCGITSAEGAKHG